MIDYFTEEQRLEMGHLSIWWDGEYVTVAELTVEDIARFHCGGRLNLASRYRKRMMAGIMGLTEGDIRDAALDIVKTTEVEECLNIQI